MHKEKAHPVSVMEGVQFASSAGNPPVTRMSRILLHPSWPTDPTYNKMRAPTRYDSPRRDMPPCPLYISVPSAANFVVCDWFDTTACAAAALAWRVLAAFMPEVRQASVNASPPFLHRCMISDHLPAFLHSSGSPVAINSLDYEDLWATAGNG